MYEREIESLKYEQYRTEEKLKHTTRERDKMIAQQQEGSHDFGPSWLVLGMVIATVISYFYWGLK